MRTSQTSAEGAGMSRATELRARHRRIFLWSLGGAALLHVAAFVIWPGFQPDPAFAPDSLSARESFTDATVLHLEILFGPPVIQKENGETFREERELEASHLLALPEECATSVEDALSATGKVGLKVWRSGRTDVTGVAQGAGGPCGDAVITALADALWYRWLPSPEHPAPVDLVQPVTVLGAVSEPSEGGAGAGEVPWGGR